MKKQLTILIFSTAFVFTACSSQNLENELNKNPDLLFKVIENNPEKFMQAVQVAASKAKELSAKNRIDREEEELEKAFSNPLQPIVTKNDAFLGPANAPITLVEYSDFECPYCSRGSEVVKSLLKQYPGKIKFVYKHLPLSFHPNAMIAAQYFEAIRLQSNDKAFKFHDMIFAEQAKLRSGEKFLKEVIKRIKIDEKKLTKDLKSKEVADKIAKDQKEAQKFDIKGTPGFVINGVPVRGAYPASHFVSIINKLKEKGKLTL